MRRADRIPSEIMMAADRHHVAQVDLGVAISESNKRAQAD